MEVRDKIGRYKITGRLGEGGMGLVYEALDERLGRTVAIKMIRAALQDSQARERFWREARAAGSLSHPNICHIYEIGEDDDALFIAMERLEGESLGERLQRGPLSAPDAAQVALGSLSALEAVHAHGLLHRDLKPSNVYLTPHGVKLLDFGLARPVETDTDRTLPMLTLPGVVLGTPGYMSPEQILGQTVDARSDLYAVGAMLFEMLSGKAPFHAPTAAEMLARVLSERPPALGGSAAVVAIDRVIQKALARNPDERYPDAASMAQDLRAALRFSDSGAMVGAEPIRRLIVLPFRLLRPDPEIDFLPFGLADAVSASLTGNDTLVVRSSLTANRYVENMPDLSMLAAEADVDLVVTGTALRSGDQIRITAQLLEVPGGRLLWSHTLTATLENLFQLQDDLASRVVESVSASLGPRRKTPEHAPVGRAHELFLRANQFAIEPRTWDRARELYEQALAEDPKYAPAWAKLGRLYRVMAKYSISADPVSDSDRAAEALQRALDLAPDLSIAVTYMAQLDMELGRSREALVRLLERTRQHPSDPHLLLGLVQACRYCGLLEASVAAHEQIRRLDRRMRTGVVHTLWLKGDYTRALEEANPSELLDGIILASMGREDEAIASFERDEARLAGTIEAKFCRVVRCALQRQRDEAREVVKDLFASTAVFDPEAMFYCGRVLARIGDDDRALEFLSRSVERGYCGQPALARDPWFDSLRGRADFRRLLERADAFQRAAASAFIAAGGERILGAPAR
jgi:eukaryotic-like serine/threonine-protein kinase